MNQISLVDLLLLTFKNLQINRNLKKIFKLIKKNKIKILTSSQMIQINEHSVKNNKNYIFHMLVI